MCFQFGAAVAMKPTRQCALILRRRFLFDHQFPGVSDQHRLPIFENASELYILEYQKLSWSLRTSSEMKSWGNLASEGSANAGSSGNENDGAAF